MTIPENLKKDLLNIFYEIELLAKDLSIIDLDFSHRLRQVLKIARQPKTEETSAKIDALKKDSVTTEALKLVFEQKNYSTAQIQAIKDAASPSLSLIIKNKELTSALAWAYTDPFSKIINNFKGLIDLKLYDNLPKILDDGIQCLEDIIYNYPELLGDNMPKIIEETLEGYREILQKLEDAFNLIDTAMETPYTPDPNKNPYIGKDHLGRLPNNFVTLGLETPEPPEPSGS